MQTKLFLKFAFQQRRSHIIVLYLSAALDAYLLLAKLTLASSSEETKTGLHAQETDLEKDIKINE